MEPQQYLPPLWPSKRNRRLKWDRNLSFPSQHNNQEDTSNSLRKKLQYSLLDDGLQTHNKSASCHEETKCGIHVEPEILSEIYQFSNCYHEALIVVLTCVKPLFLMKYWAIDIHGCEFEYISCNNENLRASICLDKFLDDSTQPKWFLSYPSSSTTNIEEVAR